MRRPSVTPGHLRPGAKFQVDDFAIGHDVRTREGEEDARGYASNSARLSREKNKLTPAQAQTVIAAAILWHLHAIITTGQAWDLLAATHGLQHAAAAMAA